MESQHFRKTTFRTLLPQMKSKGMPFLTYVDEEETEANRETIWFRIKG
jgi:hypothetical protein